MGVIYDTLKVLTSSSTCTWFKIFSLSEDEQESLDPFVPSYWKALQASGDVLEHERELIWNHWEAMHPHLFLALSSYRCSLKHVEFTKENKMEKIEAYLRRIRFLTDGAVPPNPFTIAQQALQNLVTYLESQENGSASSAAQPTMGSQSIFNQVIQPTTVASTTLHCLTRTHVPQCLPDAGEVNTPSTVQNSPHTPPSTSHMDTFLAKRISLGCIAFAQEINSPGYPAFYNKEEACGTDAVSYSTCRVMAASYKKRGMDCNVPVLEPKLSYPKLMLRAPILSPKMLVLRFTIWGKSISDEDFHPQVRSVNTEFLINQDELTLNQQLWSWSSVPFVRECHEEYLENILNQG
ncbi:hypothetical protein IW262DRAFT_1299712 [Armillaria fumosa]|nr:hypothetical protein IW262DRAFT_1299712 [Armillaria fumosa]